MSRDARGCVVRVGVQRVGVLVLYTRKRHASIDLLNCVGSLFMTFFQNFFNSGRDWSYFNRTMAHFRTICGQFDNNKRTRVNLGSPPGSTGHT